MSSFQLPSQNPLGPTQNPMSAGSRYLSSPNQNVYSGLQGQRQKQMEQIGGFASRGLSLEQQVDQVAQECAQYPEGSVQKQDCMRRLGEIVQRRDVAAKAIQDVTLPERKKTENPMNKPSAPADKSYDSVEDIRAKGAAGGYGVSTGTATPTPAATSATPAAAPAAAPTATPATSSGYADRVTDLQAKEKTLLEQLDKERTAYQELIAMGGVDRGVLRASELRINNLMSQLREVSGSIARNERANRQEIEKTKKAEEHAAWLSERRARVAAKNAPPAADRSYDSIEEIRGRAGYGTTAPTPAPSSAPEMTRIAPGMTGTQFGPMLGKFSPTSAGQPDPYAQALYNGEITPEQYRRLTEGSEQPGVSDYENAINVMTGHGQYQGGRLPAMIDTGTREGYANVPGTPNFRLPANQMQPMSRPASTQDAAMVSQPRGFDMRGTYPQSVGASEMQRFRDQGLMPNPQQSLDALNMAEARLASTQIGPAEAIELQRIRELKQRLVQQMVNGAPTPNVNQRGLSF
jgi:hypothetical protein